MNFKKSNIGVPLFLTKLGHCWKFPAVSNETFRYNLFNISISYYITLFSTLFGKIIDESDYKNFFDDFFNRYRRGLETCPQAKTSKSGHAFFFFFRRVRATSMTQRRVENTRVHFSTFSPVSVNQYDKKYVFISKTHLYWQLTVEILRMLQSDCNNKWPPLTIWL